MSDYTAEEFVQRALDLNLLDMRQVESIWSTLGSRNVPVEDVQRLVLRKELMTNWQLEKLNEGKRTGYFFGPYKILYLVGSGTFARVYRAVHVDTGKVIALKVLRLRYSDDMSRTDQFLREAKMVMELKHPNIVAIHDVNSERGRNYMVMDFVEGQNLRDWVRRVDKLSLYDGVRIIQDVCAGLDYAFKKGVQHRDMKLSNVLISSRGRASLVDFGLASIDSKRITEQNINDIPNPRSIDYAGLERVSTGGKEDKRSDIFFVGGMLYHLVTGHAAVYETKDRMKRLNPERFTNIKPITELDPNLPARLVMAINKALSVNPDERFQTPGEMLDELTEIKSLLDPEGNDVREPGTKSEAKTDTRVSVPGKLEGHSRTVMIVESNVALQDALRSRLKNLGYKVLVISDPQRALGRFEYEQAADCIVFGASELGIKALNAFNLFATGDTTTNIPAILLVHEKQKAQTVQEAKLGDHRKLVTLPLKFQPFRAMLHKLITVSPAKT